MGKVSRSIEIFYKGRKWTRTAEISRTDVSNRQFIRTIATFLSNLIGTMPDQKQIHVYYQNGKKRVYMSDEDQNAGEFFDNAPSKNPVIISVATEVITMKFEEESNKIDIKEEEPIKEDEYNMEIKITYSPTRENFYLKVSSEETVEDLCFRMNERYNYNKTAPLEVHNFQSRYAINPTTKLGFLFTDDSSSKHLGIKRIEEGCVKFEFIREDTKRSKTFCRKQEDTLEDLKPELLLYGLIPHAYPIGFSINLISFSFKTTLKEVKNNFPEGTRLVMREK